MDEKDIFGYDASENVSISKIAEWYSGLSLSLIHISEPTRH